MNKKLSPEPHDLSFYTTWWLTPIPSIASQNTSAGSQEQITLDGHVKKQVSYFFYYVKYFK